MHKDLNTAKVLNRFVLLNLARQDFMSVMATAEELIAHPVNPTDLRFRSLMAGIVVTYARSFKSNLGIGSLGNAFATFPDAILADTHRKLLALRDAMYAHRDKSKSFTRSGQTATPLYQLQIRFENADNTAIACSSNAPELNPANLPNVVKLCEFQSNKIQTEISKLLPNITGGKRYSPGTYTVGVDFP